MSIAGLLLAAGAGRRAGGPKALRRDAAGRSWVGLGLSRLSAAGCAPLFVVVGAQADLVSAAVAEAGPLIHQPVTVVMAAHWQDGMGASLREGLTALQQRAGQEPELKAAVVMLVDLPDVTPEVITRVIGAAVAEADLRDVLARAAYHGVPGHPVLLGSHHWREASVVATGDQGARSYFAQHPPMLVEAGDLATGADQDGPQR